MKRPILLLTIAACLTGGLSSCDLLGKGKLEKGTPVASTKENMEKLKAETKDETKRFAITGYLYFSPGFTLYTSRPQTVYVISHPDSSANMIANVKMSYGADRANSVFFPGEERDASKSVFYDNEGKALSPKDKVMVSFKVGQAGFFEDVRIDKAP